MTNLNLYLVVARKRNGTLYRVIATQFAGNYVYLTFDPKIIMKLTCMTWDDILDLDEGVTLL